MRRSYGDDYYRLPYPEQLAQNGNNNPMNCLLPGALIKQHTQIPKFYRVVHNPEPNKVWLELPANPFVFLALTSEELRSSQFSVISNNYPQAGWPDSSGVNNRVHYKRRFEWDDAHIWGTSVIVEGTECLVSFMRGTITHKWPYKMFQENYKPIV